MTRNHFCIAAHLCGVLDSYRTMLLSCYLRRGTCISCVHKFICLVRRWIDTWICYLLINSVHMILCW